MLEKQQTEIREIILTKITYILNTVYHESVHGLTTTAIRAQLAFKANPELNELRLALDRMDRDEYGKCIFCKNEIGLDVLREYPTAHFCSQCTDILRHRTEQKNQTTH